MNITDIRAKDTKELETMVSKHRTELRQHLIDKKTKNNDNVQSFADMRRDIARIKTVLQERQLEETK